MNTAFSSHILAERLSKLNNSQQSIESLSHWCIYHRKKAKQIVDTWEKLFKSSSKEQKIPFLYLANDILQNSRRKGNEFVIEFWKILPDALKNVYGCGDDHGKSVVVRLVDIWDERKVFGSRGGGLKDDILGKEPHKDEVLVKPPLSESDSNGRSSNPIKIMKKDSHSLRIKLAVGGMPEKIVTAYQSIHDAHFDEDSALNKCSSCLSFMGNIEKDVNDACTPGSPHGTLLVNELHNQETILNQCIDQLERVEASRSVLLSQLKEAFQEQETKLAAIQTQLQVARVETERISNLRQRLSSVNGLKSITSQSVLNSSSETAASMSNATTSQPTMISQSQSSQPVTCFAMSMITSEDETKRAAAAVAARLAASASSAQVLSSVLSSLVAEEAASIKDSLNSGGFMNGSPSFTPEKRPKLEKPISVSEMSNQFFGQMQLPQQQQQQKQPLSSHQGPSTSAQQQLSQPNRLLPSFTPPPPPMPPPQSAQQFVHPSGMIPSMMPYKFGSSVLPPLPLPSSHAPLSPARPNALQPPLPPPPPPLPPPQQKQQQQQTQQPANAGFFPSPVTSFYRQSQAIPPVARQ